MLDVKRRGGVAVDENYEIGGWMASAWREQAPSDLMRQRQMPAAPPV
jgi:hypothetical protein